MFDLRPTERPVVVAAFATLVGLSAAQALMETARDTLLLSRVPLGHLPLLTLGSAALGLLLTRLPRLLGGRRWAVVQLLLVGATVTAALPLVGHATWLPYALSLWTGAFAAGAALELWKVLGRFFDLGQAKRIFGLIAAGGGTGAVVGAGLARAVVTSAGPRLLLTLASVLLAVAALPAVLLAHAANAPAPARPAEPPAAAPTGPAARYARGVLALVFLGWAAFTVIDLLFKTQVAATVERRSLGRFFATFQLVSGGVAVVVQLAGMGALLRAVRVQRAVAIFPAALLAAAAAVLTGGGFFVVVALRGLDAGFRQPLFRTMTELLYLPLGQAVRQRLKSLADLGAARGGQVLAALAALAVIRVDARPGPLAALLVVILAGWLVAAVRVGRGYRRVLREQLGRLPPPAPRLGSSVVELDLELLEAAQQAGDPAAVSHLAGLLARRELRRSARTALAEMGEAALPPLAAALKDPRVALAVRLQIPRALAEVAGARAVPALEERLLVEEDSLIRFRVLRALVWLKRRIPALSLDEDVLGRVAWRAVEVALLCLDWRRQLVAGARRLPARATATYELLLALLDDKRRHALERLFLVLSLRYPGEDFARIRRGLDSEDPRVRAASRELLASTLHGPARDLTLLLAEAVADGEMGARTLAQVAPYYQRRPAASYRELLESIAQQGGGTLAAFAVAHAEELQPRRISHAS